MEMKTSSYSIRECAGEMIEFFREGNLASSKDLAQIVNSRLGRREYPLKHGHVSLNLRAARLEGESTGQAYTVSYHIPKEGYVIIARVNPASDNAELRVKSKGIIEGFERIERDRSGNLIQNTKMPGKGLPGIINELERIRDLKD